MRNFETVDSMAQKKNESRTSKAANYFDAFCFAKQFKLP